MRDNERKNYRVSQKIAVFAIASIFLFLQAGSRPAAAADTVTIHGMVTGVGGEPL